MTRLVVVYDEGAANPWEIQRGLAPLGELIFAVPGPDGGLTTLLAELGQVVSLDRIGALRPDAVLTFSERRLRVTSHLCSSLGLPGHSPETVELLTDKFRQRSRLRETGVDPVRSVRVDRLSDAVRVVGLPAVLKPVVGEGSRDTHLLADESDVRRWHGAARGEHVLEEYLVGRDNGPYGDYVSVESVVTRGRVSHLAVTGKFPLLRPFRECGAFWPARLDAGEWSRVLELTDAALGALGVRTGVTHTEVKLTPAGPRIIEVNGRLGGFVNQLSVRAAGVDLVRLAGLAALGGSVYLPPAEVAGVFFHYMNPAPTYPCRLVGVDGVAELRELPGITGYRRLVQPGTVLDNGVMTCCLDLIEGNARDHPSMLSTVDQAVQTLTYRFAEVAEVAEVRAGRSG